TGFKLDSDQMGRVSDVLVGAFTRSNTSLTMLGDTMKYVAPVASGLGVDLEPAAAATGKLGDAGIQGSMAGTSLRAILGRLAEPPKMA
ncbi:phage tail tape measure protein, partial [Proteus terrae]|uniref:phage tail tape measure protein n=1 Tax=Proteus terrae TaxID=1574161 RepID=UPI00301E582B